MAGHTDYPLAGSAPGSGNQLPACFVCDVCSDYRKIARVHFEDVRATASTSARGARILTLRSEEACKHSEESVTIVTSLVKQIFEYEVGVPEPELREKVSSQIASLLRELREKRGLSMTAVAAQAGLSRAMISHVEHGLRNPTVDTLLRISAVLKIEASEILRRAEVAASKKKRS